MDENQGCRVILVVNVEDAVPRLSPEEIVVYNRLNAAEKVTFLKVLGQRKEEGKEERKRGVCYNPYI